MARTYLMGRAGVRGELEVIRALEAGLPDEFIILQDVALPSAVGRAISECDSIVVGSGAVYVLEIKSFGGSIVVAEREWVIDGRTRVRDPVAMVERQAWVLGSHLRDYSPLLGKITVRALVILLGKGLQIRGIGLSTEKVVLLEDAVGRIMQLDRELSCAGEMGPELRDLVVRAITGPSLLGLEVYRSPGSEIEEEDKPLVLDYLCGTVVPYLRAVEALLQVADEAGGLTPRPLEVYKIAKESPLSLSFDGVGSVLAVIQEVVVPWRRGHAKDMARLLVIEKEASIEGKKAEVIEKRSQAQRERAEAERVAAETERLRLENERLRLELELRREYHKLALEALRKLRVDVTAMDEEKKQFYAEQLVEPLKLLTSSELVPVAGSGSKSNGPHVA